jgi:hypothetical protein
MSEEDHYERDESEPSLPGSIHTDMTMGEEHLEMRLRRMSRLGNTRHIGKEKSKYLSNISHITLFVEDIVLTGIKK